MQLDEILNQINELVVGQPANKSKFREHIEKVIRKAEEYGQYLRTEWKKAEKAGLTICDKNKDEEKWFWWTPSGMDSWGENVYFADDEYSGVHVQFYIDGKPKPDPLGYLRSMVLGSVGGMFDGLKLLNYQFLLLAIFHDAQNWQAGGETIYFNNLKNDKLSDRICQAVWHRLLEMRQRNQYEFKNVQNAIETALRAVKSDLAMTKKSQTSDGVKSGFNLVCKVVVGIGFLLGILYTAIQIRESDTFKQFVVPQTQLQPTSDMNAQTDFNNNKQLSKSNDNISTSLPDSNLLSPESPNQ